MPPPVQIGLRSRSNCKTILIDFKKLTLLFGVIGALRSNFPFSYGDSYRPLVLFLQKMEDKLMIDILHVWHSQKSKCGFWMQDF